MRIPPVFALRAIASTLLLSVLQTLPAGGQEGGTWTTLAPLQIPRQEIGAARIGDRVLVVGGLVEERVPTETVESGLFRFFTPENVELAVKILDGRAINGHLWLFYGALSDVGYTLTVTDTLTRGSKVYANEQGTLASVADPTGPS